MVLFSCSLFYVGLLKILDMPTRTATTTSDCVCDEDEFINLGKGIGLDVGKDVDQQEGSGGLSFSIIFY